MFQVSQADSNLLHCAKKIHHAQYPGAYDASSTDAGCRVLYATCFVRVCVYTHGVSPWQHVGHGKESGCIYH